MAVMEGDYYIALGIIRLNHLSDFIIYVTYLMFTDLNDECQSTLECTETPNTVCSGGRCSCGEGYQQEDDFCAASEY